ncbi:carboxylate--amine ligase [Acidaminobacter sp. JC074]|uniref:carboxylate--amine ligase n=1 Tax=Acidaminobacter sp. JC074 TaxID=2530199 RepID=UPI001F0EAF65|nr:carboxylate--amine ligase [Acidaminobacter sp. JC074]MCH4886890.1 carboxylate--amine ligase [Acidaminobacter sp. JC074]
MKNKAVILGANYYIGLSVIRCLGRNGITTVAIEYQEQGTYGFKSKYLSEKHIAPHYRKDTQGFIKYLIDYAKKQTEKPVLFPCADPYVEIIDEHLDELRNYYLINQTQQGLFTKLMDKNSLYDIALEHGVKVPETIKTSDPEFESKISDFQYPCIVKPSDSPAFVDVFRKKMFKVNNKTELLEAVRKANDKNLEVFVQRIIPGFDNHMYTYDCYLDQNSKVTHYTTANKNRQYPINFGASVYTWQIHVPSLHEIGKPFLEAVGFKGFAEIEFKKDAVTGDFYLIEINVRTTNFNVLLEKVGLNFPWIAYKELTGQEIGSQALVDSTKRTFVYAFEDILAIKGYLQTRQLTLGQVFKSFFRKKAYAIWAFDDPKPYFNVIGILIGKVFKKLTGK